MINCVSVWTSPSVQTLTRNDQANLDPEGVKIMAKETISVRLTPDNVETELRTGDVFADDPAFGIVTNVYALTAGAKVWTTTGTDVLGLPQTVNIERYV